MIKMNINLPSESDLIKRVTAAAEKKIAETARRAAAKHGGVRIHFSHKSDGSLASVNFEGTQDAVQAAREAVAS